MIWWYFFPTNQLQKLRFLRQSGWHDPELLAHLISTLSEEELIFARARGWLEPASKNVGL